MPCLSWTPESLLEMVRCLRDSFSMWMEGHGNDVGKFYSFASWLFWIDVGNYTPKDPKCPTSMWLVIGPLKGIETCKEFRLSHMWSSCFHEIIWCLTAIALRISWIWRRPCSPNGSDVSIKEDVFILNKSWTLVPSTLPPLFEGVPSFLLPEIKASNSIQFDLVPLRQY